MVRFSEAVSKAAPYPFKKINDIKAEYIKKGVRVIDLGVGDTVLPAPQCAVEVLKKEAEKAENHHYNFYNGYPFFREAAAEWMAKKYGVKLDPEREITALSGTKEGLFRISPVLIDSGDTAIITAPAYPVVQAGVEASGGNVFSVPLREKNNFLPDFSEIPEEVKKKAKYIYVNYPNNPTSAVMNRDFAAELISYAEKYDWAVISDMAYSEVYETTRNLSLLDFDPDRKRVVEFHSLSKTFSMTGFRIGFAAGAKEIISSLVKIKSIRDSSVFQPVQAAGAAAMLKGDLYLEEMRRFYKKNRMLLKSILIKNAIEYFDSESTFYVWAKVPDGMSSMEFSAMMIERYGTVVTPGSILGNEGEGWFRACFACRTEDLTELGNRVEGVK